MKKIYKLTKGLDSFEGTVEFICERLGCTDGEFLAANRTNKVICGYHIKLVGKDGNVFANAEEVEDFKKRWRNMQKQFKGIKWVAKK